MENKVEKIKALGKDAIIKMTKDLIEEKYPTVKIDLGNFDIKVFADDEEVLVEFFRVITFFPIEAEWRNYRSKLHVYLISKRFQTTFTHGENVEYFFCMLQEHRAPIEFVKKALKISDPIYKGPGGGWIIIKEEDDEYRVMEDNLGGYSTCFIDKITGNRDGGVTARYGKSQPLIEGFGLKIKQKKNLLRD